MCNHERACHQCGGGERLTPPEVFEALGLTFDLDPCSPGAGRSYVPALQHFTREDDGLTRDWGRSLVWVHPPDGPDVAEWMDKAASHGNGIALVVPGTDGGQFDAHRGQADLVCSVDSPIRFFEGDISKRNDVPCAGSLLLAYGLKAAAALKASGLGPCFVPVPGTDAIRPDTMSS